MATTFTIKQVQANVQDENGKDKLFYQVFCNGNVGTIYGFHGIGVHHLKAQDFIELKKLTGLNEIQTVMHERVIQYLSATLPKEIELSIGDALVMPDGYPVRKVTFKVRG